MPRTAGVSSNTLVLFSLRRPRPTTVARCEARVPMGLRTSLTVTVFLSDMFCSWRSADDLFDRLATLGGDFRGRRSALQAVQRGANHVVRIRRTVALGHDVSDTHDFEDSAHRAASNHAGTSRSRCHDDVCSTVLTDHVVVDRAIAQADLDHVA